MWYQMFALRKSRNAPSLLKGLAISTRYSLEQSSTLLQIKCHVYDIENPYCGILSCAIIFHKTPHNRREVLTLVNLRAKHFSFL